MKYEGEHRWGEDLIEYTIVLPIYLNCPLSYDSICVHLFRPLQLSISLNTFSLPFSLNMLLW